jgi:hypothetical protein
MALAIEVPSLSGLTQAFRMLLAFIDARTKKRRTYLEEEIDPIFRTMESIHLEYLSTFQQVRDLARNRAAPPEIICEFLKQHRLETLHIRELTKELAAALKLGRAARSANRELEVAVWRFSRSVREYFGSVLGAGSASWYSHFVDVLTWVFELDENPWDIVDQTIGGNPVRSTIDGLDHLLQRVLPSRWRSICRAYAILRALLV